MEPDEWHISIAFVEGIYTIETIIQKVIKRRGVGSNPGSVLVRNEDSGVGFRIAQGVRQFHYRNFFVLQVDSRLKWNHTRPIG